MVQNFLQLTFKNQTTGLTVEVMTFTTDEVPAGIVRNAPYKINAFNTTGGKSRTFQEPDGITFSFSVVLSDNATLGKLDRMATYIALGRIVDAQALIGAMIYNVPSDRLVYNAAIGVILSGVVTEFDFNYRQMVAGGQRSRNETAIVIREGGSNSLPLAANYVGN